LKFLLHYSSSIGTFLLVSVLKKLRSQLATETHMVRKIRSAITRLYLFCTLNHNPNFFDTSVCRPFDRCHSGRPPRPPPFHYATGYNFSAVVTLWHTKSANLTCVSYVVQMRTEDCVSFIIFHYGVAVDGTGYPRDAMLARVFAIATCPSVRPSVCLSVTRRYCA